MGLRQSQRLQLLAIPTDDIAEYWRDLSLDSRASSQHAAAFAYRSSQDFRDIVGHYIPLPDHDYSRHGRLRVLHQHSRVHRSHRLGLHALHLPRLLLAALSDHLR